ncbi:MAG: FHA domain-containing protein [Limisphaerales bacterium]
MIQFSILTGKKAGVTWAARRYPVRIGRAATADLQLDEEGVWDRHLQVDFKPRDGFYVSAQANALATVNSQPFRETRLRNGDCLEIGALKMRFWLGQTRQVGLRFREWLTWAAIAGICLAQIALIYWLGA